jgi:hypothetical protein
MKDDVNNKIIMMVNFSNQSGMICFSFISYLGITEHNYVDVKSCLSMSQDEKLVRRAAREMFSW